MLKRSRESTNNYLVKQLPKATVFVNKTKTIVYASDRWVHDFELGNSEVIGKNITKLFKNSNTAWQKSILECFKGLPNLTLTANYRDSNGNTKYFELKSTPWYDQDENVIGAIIQVENITQRVQAETKLQKLEIISEDISDMAEIGFWDFNLAEDNMFWDSRTKAIHEVSEDYTPNLIDSLDFYKLGNSRNTISMTVNKAITHEIPFSEKLQIITAKGNEIWVITSGKPVYKEGKFSGMVGTIQNVNERHLNEIKTKENQHLLRTLIDNLPVCVCIKDLESRKLLVNKAEMEFCNVTTKKEIIGKDDFHFFDRATAELARKDDLAVMKTLKPILNKECTHGREGTYLVSKIPLVDTDGHAYGLVNISTDISDIKRKELELRDSIKTTSSQNEKLINFAHIVSHNLRSHTSNFSMLLNFLCQEDCEVERQKIMDMLIDSSNNLQETLNNLNEVVDININNSLERKTVALREKIVAIEQSLAADLMTHSAKIINKVSVKTKIKTIPAYIDSILGNFITNAIKYRSPDRKPVITLNTSKKKNYTVLSITDNGLGIDLDKYGDKLFGMYKTFHDHPDSKGIGLYITKNQIEAMNGKVAVTSEVGVGTTFKIYFNDKN